MFLVNITLKLDKVPTDKADEMFTEHRAWFAKYFQAGTFLLLGPYLDRDHAGVIIAYTETREELDKILAEDVYYSFGGASYEVNEFKAAMASDISPLQGK